MVLRYGVNAYGDAMMKTSELAPEVLNGHFTEELMATFGPGQADRIKAIWMYIDIKDSHVVPELVKLGFTFIHATTNQLTMACWLGDEPSRLPSSSNSYYSVAGLVTDARGRILLVREERYGELVWKFPGGPGQADENLLESAARKVLDEARVIAKGETVISLRQKVRTPYKGTCGFFFICLMRYIRDAPAGTTAKVSDEIAETRWFTRAELISLPPSEFFAHHRDIWIAYENRLSLMNNNSQNLITVSGNRSVTSSMFNFSFF